MNDHDSLRGLLAQFDPAAFGDSVAAGLIPTARAEVPELALVPDAALRDLLAAAAMHGATALIGAAQMQLAVEGPGSDSALEALASTVEAVRFALSCIFPAEPLPPEEHDAQTAVGVQALAHVVTSWDQAQAAAAT